EVQRGILLWARMWRARRAPSADPGAREELYRAICIRSVARPLDHELELFGHWQHDENFGSRGARSLVEVADLHEWERCHLSAHQLASLPHARVYWPFGFAHGLSRAMGEAVAAIHLRLVHPRLLASGDGPRVLAFYWDSGDGFRPEEMRIEPYELNNRGRVWQRLALRMNGGRLLRFGVTIGVKGEVVQLTGARVHRRGRTGEPRVETYPHEVLEMSGYRRLHDSLYLVEEDPALIVIPAPGLDGFHGEVDVDLFFSVVG
ncbi:MAG TPA: hypothetical protein VMS88_04370, partial [Terriglobales bacterium]|nr:hypothetical protein [Terriglobales bacterium]